MPLETATFIDDLVATNPVGATDQKLQGDDHIRLVKSAVKATFPNASRAFDLRGTPGTFAETELTLSGGNVTAVGSSHGVDTEADAATDDLDHILQTDVPTGSVLILHAADAARVVTVKHETAGAGQITLADGTDLVLDSPGIYLMLLALVSSWKEIGRFYPGLLQARGDIWRGGINGNPERLAKGATGSLAITDADDVTWLAPGTNGQTLQLVSGAPVWALTTPRGYIDGFELAKSGTSGCIFAAGVVRDSANALTIERTTSITKQLGGTWVEGAGLGGLFFGAKAPDTEYHCFLIRKDADGTIDAGFDPSSSGANVPAGWSNFQRVGSVFTDSVAAPNSAIHDFFQRNHKFTFVEPFHNGGVAPTTSAALHTLKVPSGFSVGADIFVYNRTALDTIDQYGLVTSPTQTDFAPSATRYNLIGSRIIANFSRTAAFSGILDTDSSARIRTRFNIVNGTLDIFVNGWEDPRGRNA